MSKYPNCEKYRERRNYPVQCTSAFCGKTDCTGCVYEQKLLDFKTWRDQHQGIQIDPLWTPTIYEASKPIEDY